MVFSNTAQYSCSLVGYLSLFQSITSYHIFILVYFQINLNIRQILLRT